MMQRFGRVALLAAAAWGTAIGLAQAGEVTFWTWRQEDRTAYTELFNDFTKKNPSITVKFESFAVESYATTLSTALAAGKGADVIHTRAYGGLEQFAKAGYLLALDPAAVPELGNLPADALSSTTLRADKKVYSLPFASQTLGLFINREVFSKAGLNPPETWEQLLTVGKALKDKGITPLANGVATAWMAEVFTSVFTNPHLGPEFVADLLSGKATFEDARYIAALGKLLELRDLMPQGFTGVDYATSQQLFLSGRAAMFAGGSFEIANFRKQNPGLKMEFLAPPAPAGKATYVSKFFDGGYAVNAKSTNQADALTLVRWMGTKEFGDKFSNLLGNISPIAGVQIADPMLAGVSKLNTTSMPYITAVYFRYDSPTGSELLQSGIQKMMAGNATPAEVGASMTQGIKRYYVPFQK
jgi:raffinose/stachyose/melibiose transport system substrate-binding protein